jgi:beta-aspartyl-peptidase (threonine type)
LNGKVVVHGGAGRWRLDEGQSVGVIQTLKRAAESAVKVIRSGNAVDAVVEAVCIMEESGAFNAGRGSVLNLEGEMELDAGIMDGEKLLAGGVGCVKDVPHPVKLARVVMEKTAHVLMVSSGAEKLAEAYGLREKLLPTKQREENYAQNRKAYVESPQQAWLKNLDANYLRASGVGDTVGAVAIDDQGKLAAATSTGGIPFKLPGRVGDSPLAGLGFYAMKDIGAASATGTGELIAKYGLCLRTINYMAERRAAPVAAKMAIEELSRLFGGDTAGVIAIDSRGVPGVFANTEAIAVAFCGSGTDPYAKLVKRDEIEGFRRVISRRL